MAFDAGTIIAHLEIDQDKADRDLDRFKARVKEFEREGHKVRIGAEFDSPSLAKAKRIFEQLDNQLSRDAMNRLRSSPNGSVLGALNALFSPHQLSGAPTPQQSAQGGLLGRMAGSQGTAQAGTGSVLTQLVKPAGQSGTINQNVRERLVGPRVGPDGTVTQKVQLKADNAATQAAANEASRSFSKRFDEGLSRIFGGGGKGGGGGLLGRLALGAFGGGTGGQGFGKGLLGGIGPGILGLGLKASGIAGVGGGLLGALPSLIGGLSPLLAAAPGLIGIQQLLKGSLQNIQPLTQLQQQIQSQQAAGLGATAAGAKQIAAEQAQLKAGFAALTGPQKQLFNAVNNLQNAWQKLTTSFTPLAAKALGGVASLFQQLLPQLNKFFAASGQLIQPLIGGLGDIAKQLLPLFTAGIKAAAPEIRPLLDGLGKLVAGIFPGLIALVKVSLPAVQALAQVLGGLGKDIGGLFAALAPGVKASVPILKALFDLLGAVFPIVGKLATILANALGPVFVAFATSIKALLPFLTIIGKVLAALAGAVLADLVSAFTALAQLLVLVSPSLQVLAKALSSVFTVLENSGVFAILGNALEAIVPLLAQLINTLVIGLAPVLPKIIQLVSNLAGDAIKVLVAAFKALLPVAIVLVQDALIPLLPVLNALIPVITVVAGLLASGLAAVLSAIAPLLKVIAPFVLAIVAAVKLWAIAQGILNIALDANPIGLITIAIAALVIGIIELVKHWKTVWTDIKAVGLDAWHFLDNLLHNQLVKTILDVWSLGLIPLAEHWKTVWNDIRNLGLDAWHFLDNLLHNQLVKTILDVWSLGLIPLSQHWGTVWGDIKNVASGAWSWLNNNIFHPMNVLFTQTLPGWFSTAVSAIGRFWNGLENTVKAPVKFVVDDVLDGLISVFDTVLGAVGLGSLKIPQVHPFGLAAGGRIPGYGGGDRWPALLESGEVVVPKEKARPLSDLWSAIGIPGFARGGKVGQNAPHPGIVGSAIDVGKIVLALATGNATAATNAFLDLMGAKGTGGAAGKLASILTQIPKLLVHDAIHFLLGQVGTSGSAIADFAAQYLGKIPYVWGGTSLFTGADCSGFVQAIYKHFGILAPRTSEAQGAWVKRGPPTPGGLAFYHSPPGGPDPGHVAIVRNINQVISQGGGLGPQLMPLHGLPLLWTGTPPGGFGTQPGTKVSGSVASWLMQAMAATAVPSWWLAPLEKIQSLETDNLPNMTTVVNPNGGATGLMQVKPGTFAQFFKFPGGIFNPVTNAIAAIRHIQQAWNGSPLNIPGIGAPGVYQGYKHGGVLPEPVFGWGPSGKGYAMHAGETILPAGGSSDVLDVLHDIADSVDQLIAEVRASSARTGAAMGGALTRAARAAGNAALYP